MKDNYRAFSESEMAAQTSAKIKGHESERAAKETQQKPRKAEQVTSSVPTGSGVAANIAGRFRGFTDRTKEDYRALSESVAEAQASAKIEEQKREQRAEEEQQRMKKERQDAEERRKKRIQELEEGQERERKWQEELDEKLRKTREELRKTWEAERQETLSSRASVVRSNAQEEIEFAAQLSSEAWQHALDFGNHLYTRGKEIMPAREQLLLEQISENIRLGSSSIALAYDASTLKVHSSMSSRLAELSASATPGASRELPTSTVGAAEMSTITRQATVPAYHV